MTEGSQLDEAARQALVDLVVRGMWRGEASPPLQALVDRGLALSKGPIVMPSPAGSALAGEVTRLPAGSQREQQVRSLFEAFLPINRRLREVCTDWQRRPDGSANDHTDAGYDAAVRDHLDDVHGRVRRILRRLGEAEPSLAHYTEDLAQALQRLDDGDASMLTSPLKDSYHTVWMRLHQELLMMLGISRAEDEALEERLVSGQPG
jgi:hypothetical protein